MPKALIYNIIAEKKNVSINRLETLLGASHGSIRKAIERDADIKSSTLEKIVSTFPDINKEWLYSGVGEPFTEPQPPAKAEKEMSLKDFLPTKSRFEELKNRSIEEALLGDILTRLAKVEIEIERLKQSH